MNSGRVLHISMKCILAECCFSREKKIGEQFHLALKYLRFVAEIIRGEIGASRRRATDPQEQ
jgi:hypothetical protein